MRDPGKFLKATLLAVLAVMTLVVTLLVSEDAWAADRVVVVHAEGPDSDAIAKDVKASLPKGLTAGDPKEFNGELAKQGQKGAFGKALDGKQREKLLERVRKAAKASSVDVVVILRVKKDKGGRTVTILVIDPKTTAPMREDEVSLPAKKGKDDSKPVVASIGPALGASPAATTPEPEKKPEKATPEPEKKPETAEKPEEKTEEPKKEEKPEPAGARPTGEYNRALFVIGLGVDLGLRNFDYNQSITPNLRAYSVKGAPMLAVDAELYPLAGGGGPLGDIGLVGLYSRALALQSAPQGGQKYATTWDRWFAGLRYRIRTSGDKGPLVGITVGYGHEGFTFSGMPETLDHQVAAEKYGFVKAAADVRLPVGPLAIMAGAGYLFTSTSGSDASTVSGRFTRAKVGGIEAHLGAGLQLTKGLEARVVARYTRFFWSMNPELGDTYIAGGAVDTFASLHLGVAYAF